jgi:hypothetical protein
LDAAVALAKHDVCDFVRCPLSSVDTVNLPPLLLTPASFPQRPTSQAAGFCGIYLTANSARVRRETLLDEHLMRHSAPTHSTPPTRETLNRFESSLFRGK